MVKIERTPTPPASLAIEKEKEENGFSGSYNQEDVVDQLNKDFHGKCYLCEQDELQAIEIEHLKPHHGGKYIDLKYDWNNLFFSCSHCNSVKNRLKYEKDILDCCVTDPETVIHQALVNGQVVVKPLLTTPEAQNTADLVQDCFELRNTTIRSLESQNKVTALKRTMNLFFKKLDELENEANHRTLRVVRGMLSRQYKFSGFTRTYVRDNIGKYPDLAPYVQL